MWLLKETWRRFRKNRLAMAGLIILIILILLALLAPVIAAEGYDNQVIAERNIAPFVNSKHILGTDQVGRDMLTRLVWGGRVTLRVGVVSVGISLIGGLIFGSIAGFFGGTIENVIMRVMDVLLAIPGMLLALAISAALGAGMTNAIISVGIAGIATFSRVVRSSIMTIRDMEYVEAARSINASNTRIIFREILPNCLAPILVQATLSMAWAVMQTSSLSFLGLGIQPPVPEWGSMISEARSYMRELPWLVILPGFFIMLDIFAVNVIGDGLRDALDPKLRK